MKKQMIILLTVCGLVLGVAASGAAFRGPYCFSGWPGMQPGLNLTPDQTRAFTDLQNEFRGKITPLNQALTQKQLEKERLLAEKTPDGTALEKVQAEISSLEAELNQIGLSYQLKARTILTAEQLSRVPNGCGFGFYGLRTGYPAGYGTGYGYGRGRGCGKGRGFGRGHGCRW